ncbi:MAG: murein transglycosylase [Desulfobacteraceae bacterium]|nr:murein transglycosylase [Desulfobacteraceae bacterium]
MNRPWRILFIVTMCISACGPAHKPKLKSIPMQMQMSRSALVRLDGNDIPLFEDPGQSRGLAQSIEYSLQYLRRLPPDKMFHFGENDSYSAAHMIRSLESFSALMAKNPSFGTLNRVLRQHYWIYQASGQNGVGDVLFTGYYEPFLEGSRRRTPEYPVPVHSRPSDLLEINLSQFDPSFKGYIIGSYNDNTLKPYPDSAQIRKNQNFNKIAPPVVWLKDQIDLFNLQLQGSGKIVLQDGSIMGLCFGGSNGRPYRSIGRLLINQGKITPAAMSMQAIRTYLQQNPEELDTIINHNPRYIFFKENATGSIGSIGQPLTPLRSIAIDHSIFPSGALAFFKTQVPDVDQNGKITKWINHGGFVLAQDAGKAIKGPGRADLFWGHGLRAEVSAGNLKNPGSLYFMVLRPGVNSLK